MATSASRHRDSSLLDRDAEVPRLGAAVNAARGGSGQCVFVTGEAGIGKTELLRVAQRLAAKAGMRVRGARGGPVEREFPFGVVRQLFDGLLARMPVAARRRLFVGAAAGAAAVVAGDAAAVGSTGLDLAQALHALYWLCSNLADDRPLVLAVDDAHWSDPESVRWLSYMAHRVDELPVLLVVATRTGDEPVDRASLEAIEVGASQVLRPGALSEAASTALVRRSRGSAAAEFCRACHRASGGNPFYLRELVAETERKEIAPTAAAADRVAVLGPRAISTATLTRLGRLEPPAAEIARAVAVLGLDTELRHAAGLAGVPLAEAERAADSLTEAGILESRRPLNFIHPVVAVAIHASIAPGAVSQAHARAADLLAAEHADAAVVASHLLLVEPAAGATVRARLVRAVRVALARGAPATAARFLRRAVAETPIPEQRAPLLVSLGRAELMAGEPTAVASLSDAVEQARDPELLVQATELLANALAFAGGRFAEADEMVRRVIERLALPPDHLLVLRLESSRLSITAFDSRFAADVAARLPLLVDRAARAGDAARPISIVAATRAAIGLDEPDRVGALLDRGLGGEGFRSPSFADSVTAGQAVCALAFVDELERADSLLDELFASARQRNSVVTYVTALVWHGWVALRRGEVPTALADERAALELCRQHGLLFPLPWAQAFLAGALLDAHELDEAEALAESLPLDAVALEALRGMALDVRGRVRLARGRRDDGVADLESVGAVHESIGQHNPNATHWRSTLAVALGRGSPRALELAHDELVLARRSGCTRAVGVALRAQGRLEGGAEGTRALREAAAILEASPARLEHARALCWLGAELRRRGRRSDAREPLRLALDAADRLGAARVAAEARVELVAAGGRPRRQRLSGTEALTPTERRVADMAAAGLRNKEIAQALFVSLKTVEMHLGSAYRKLGIHRRDDLPRTLTVPRS